ncbi:hypothetical protein AALC75_18245 [Lachnospiraceae bacterium 48-42]
MMEKAEGKTEEKTRGMKIPVRIFGGCVVDFQEIWEYVSFLE